MFLSMNIYAKIAFAAMVGAMALSYFYGKKRQRDLRLACNRFAFAFAKLSNFVLPAGEGCTLLYEPLPDGTIRLLPAQQQSPKLEKIRAKVAQKQVEIWYDEAQQALGEVTRLCGINRTLRQQFGEPIQRLFDLLRIFLVGCDDLSSITTEQDAEVFNSFLADQLAHRKVLLQRISGDAGKEYATLSKGYDLWGTDEKPPVTVPKEETALPANSDVQAAPSETDLREKWRGWG